jgi:hypothetical protein
MLDSWMEWKRQCALDLCTPEVRGGLTRFAGDRFRSLLVRLDCGLSAPAPREAWHLFETHLTVTSTRGGKRYKDWLFARVADSADPPVDVIQGGATLILRDVVRNYLRNEAPRTDTLSLDAPAWGEGTGALTFVDLLPDSLDPADEIALRDYEALARKHAADGFAASTRRERVLLLASELGVPFYRKQVEDAAGCRKTALHASYRDLVMRIGRGLTREYADDDSESVLALTLMTLSHMKKAAREWALAEKSFSDLFNMVEAGPDTAGPGHGERIPGEDT